MRGIPIIGLWIILTLSGLFALNKFSYTEGPIGLTKSDWPFMSKINYIADAANLVVFLHPKCSCSLATVAELERLMVHIKDKINTHVVFSNLGEDKRSILNSQLMHKVQALEGVVSIYIDEGDVQSTLFGAQTSGQTYLYDEKNKLVFAGGITPSRGHRGDSIGREAVLQWVKSRNNQLVFSPTYGCLIKEDSKKLELGEL